MGICVREEAIHTLPFLRHFEMLKSSGTVKLLTPRDIGDIPQVYISTCLKKKNGSGSVTHPRYKSRCYSPFLPHGHKTKWSPLDALQTPSWWWWWWMNDTGCSLLPDTVHRSFLLPFCGQLYWLPRFILRLLPPELCLEWLQIRWVIIGGHVCTNWTRVSQYNPLEP